MTGVSLYWINGDSLHEARRAMAGLGYEDIKEGERAGRGDIIVVDNDEIVARVLKKAVERRGAEVLTLGAFMTACAVRRETIDRDLPRAGLTNSRLRVLDL